MFTRPGRSHFFLLNSCEIQHFQLSQGLEIIFFRNPTEIHDSTRETIAAKIASRTNSLTCSGWWLSHPSEKYEFVNGKDDIPYMKWKIKIMFETTNQLFILIIFFCLKMIMPFLSQLFISLFFHSCFSRCFLPLAFSFFLPLPLKLSLGVAKRNFFSNPFRFFFFFVLYRFGYLSFLCLENCQKMPKEVFSRTLFVFSFWLFFLPLHFKLTLEIVKRSIFSNPFASFFASCFSFF